MKKVWAFILAIVLCAAFSGVALAKSQDLAVLDNDGNPVSGVEFKLHPEYELTSKVDTVWLIPIYDDYDRDALYAAAEAAYPGETVYELGRINMSGYDPEYDYIFDYFGPFTAKVENPAIHNGDKVAVFMKHGCDEENVEQVKGFCVKNGTFSFRDSAVDFMEVNCVYVILD